ncbi:MAG TPA: hypothetical protein VGG28_02285 [Kofleriaceae bacterium]|jgi:hypothetical protein
MKRAIAVGLALVIAAPAFANPPKKASAAKKGSGDDDDDDDDDDAGSGRKFSKANADAKGASATQDKGKDAGDDDDDDDDDDAKTKPKTGSAASESSTTQPTEEMHKQDLTGHDMATNKKTTAEEKDRFFVDKVDTDSTKNSTLVQGSLTLSAFLYSESGGNYGTANGQMIGNDTTAPPVYWTDLRLQTDFRHIGGGRWDGRVDFRARFVNTPGNDVVSPNTPPETTDTTQPNLVQSGLTGQNEYDLRELWLIRNGDQTDVIFGRQYIPDLGAVKIDGLRVDYASSTKLTYLGFAGLYPLRGSRSLSTDYTEVIDPTSGQNDGRFTGAGGFGAAYRTQQAYGSFGGVALVPLSVTGDTRLFATSTGYWRINPQLDFYHFALLDVAHDSGITNLSAGLNYKPTQRLRLTASFNRVDTDTIDIQAAQFFTNPGLTGTGATLPTTGIALNEIYIAHIATNEARGSISAALGNNERFQLTAAASYKERPDFTLDLSSAPASGSPTGVPIESASSVEIYASIIDRYSVKDLRLGVDAEDQFPIGNTPYDRVKTYSARVFASHELASGKGEWEADLSYSSATDTNDSAVGINCTTVASCYGASSNGVYSLGGTLYYRLTRDVFLIGSAYLQRTSITTTMPAGNDAPINGFTGFFRLAYRF